VDQLRDKILCTSPTMTLLLSFCSHLLERWTSGMHHIVVLVNTEIIFYHLSLRIAFSTFILRNNPRQIIPSYPNSKTAKITVCCIAQVTWIDFSTHIFYIMIDMNVCISQQFIFFKNSASCFG